MAGAEGGGGDGDGLDDVRHGERGRGAAGRGPVTCGGREKGRIGAAGRATSQIFPETTRPAPAHPPPHLSSRSLCSTLPSRSAQNAYACPPLPPAPC